MEVYEHEGDPLYWFYLRVACILFYISIFARQFCRPGWSRYIREVAKRTAEESCPKRRQKEAHSVIPDGLPNPGNYKDFQADIAFEVLTQAIGPYCFVTVFFSLIRNFTDEDPWQKQASYGLLFGDANTLTLLIISILWSLNVRPNMKWRMIIYVILAVWYSYISARAILDPGLILSEDVWMNHMVFLAITSLGLGLPRPYVWLQTLAHSTFFLSYTLRNVHTNSPDLKYKPSAGLQIFLVATLAVFAKYSEVLAQVNQSQAEVEFALRAAELNASTQEEEARRAKEEARIETERANVAEAEARAARAENEAHEAKVKADLAEQGKNAMEERANLVECTRGAFQHLLDLLCDAVVELDGDLKLNTPGKLGVLLSHGTGTDLRGRPFKDLIVEGDRERFEHWVSSNLHEFPLQVTLLGSYNAKVKVIVYVTGISDLHGQTLYFVGITEAEEQENEFCGRNASKQSVASLSHIGTEELVCHSISELYQDIQQEPRSAPTSPSGQSAHSGQSSKCFPAQAPTASSKGTTESKLTKVSQIEPMEPEDQMQALLALIWSWPCLDDEQGPSRCCHTHEMLDIAMDRLKTLRNMSCTPRPSCLVWQCPSCKLLGLPEDSQCFDEVHLHCGRCRSWDMLF